MMTRDVMASDLAGCIVRDTDGRRVGRITELAAEIELHAKGNDYVVTEIHVSSFGPFEWAAGLYLVQQLVERLGPRFGYRCYRVPWALVDFSDVARPVLHGEITNQKSTAAAGHRG